MSRRLNGWCLTLVLWLGATSPTFGDQNDPRLAPLFERLEQAQSLEQARALSDEIWAIWSEAPDARAAQLMERGITAMSAGRYTTAFAAFSELVEHSPNFAEAWNKRATLNYMIGSYEASIDDIERTLALEPRHFGALSGLGLIMMAVDRPQAAKRSFEAALSINPYLPAARSHIEALESGAEGAPI